MMPDAQEIASLNLKIGTMLTTTKNELCPLTVKAHIYELCPLPSNADIYDCDLFQNLFLQFVLKLCVKANNVTREAQFIRKLSINFFFKIGFCLLN